MSYKIGGMEFATPEAMDAFFKKRLKAASPEKAMAKLAGRKVKPKTSDSGSNKSSGANPDHYSELDAAGAKAELQQAKHDFIRGHTDEATYKEKKQSLEKKIKGAEARSQSEAKARSLRSARRDFVRGHASEADVAKAKEQADAKSYQTGPKGGRYYISGNGDKVYVK